MQNDEQGFSFKSLFVPFTTFKAIQWIIVIGFVVYFNSLFNGFVSDDFSQIVNNSSVHSFLNIPQFFSGSTFSSLGSTTLSGTYYKPLLLTLFSVLYTLFGNWSPAYHAFQLLLHISNCILLFFVFRKFFKTEIVFVISLLFLISPINNEAVVYISAMQEPLFLFFGLLAFLLTQQRKNNYYKSIIIVLLLFCSILSKETGVLFLIMIPLFTLLFSHKWKVEVLQSSIAIGMYLIFRFFIAHVFINQAMTDIPFIHTPILIRLGNIPAIMLFYIKSFFLPVRFNNKSKMGHHTL